MRVLTAIALAGLLAGCGLEQDIPTPETGLDKMSEARLLRAHQEMRMLASEVEQHHAFRGEWPRSWRDVRRSGMDPWGHEYVLEIENDRPLVWSTGPDGEAGTDDDVFLP